MSLVVTAYYWKQVPNFGDLLTPLLIQRFTRLPIEWASPADAELVVVGSVIDVLPKDWTGVIAGAGKLHEHNKVPNTKILGLRGPLTARGIKGTFALGDPGLLADELVKRQDKQYDLGIVPHWTDKTLEHDKRFLKYKPKIIRVSDDPLDVIREISQCKKIVSSSLHGVVLADAFGIPRRIELAPRMLSHPHQEGGLYKWQDYNASLNMPLEIGITKQPSSFMVTQRQHELFDMFREVKSIYK